MGLMDPLRKAGEQGKAAARRGWEQARETWEDGERRLRRKMRLYPSMFPRRKPAPVLPIPGPGPGAPETRKKSA